MRVYAVSDLHVGYERNRNLLKSVSDHSDDWLILAGDLGETEQDLNFVFSSLGPKFAKLVWVPGNHELWTTEENSLGLKGVEKYNRMVDVCRSFNVLTPEDPYPHIDLGNQDYYIAPIFTLYDYSFGPEFESIQASIAWALEHELYCADESLLHSTPFATKREWCHERCQITKERLKNLPKEVPIILINHFPMRYDLLRIYRIPRFSIWCGTRLTENWHKEFNVKVVVSGHQHVRYTEFIDDVRFEEVSLGYPKQWNPSKTLDDYLRLIAPEP